MTTSTLLSVDERLRTLTHRHTRLVLYYFNYHSTATSTVEELGSFICEQSDHDTNAERVRVRLHHETLPKLAETGVIDYDGRTRTVRHWAENTHERFGAILAACKEYDVADGVLTVARPYLPQ